MPLPYVAQMSAEGVAIHVAPEPGRTLESAQEAAREALTRLETLISICKGESPPKISLERNGRHERSWTFKDDARKLNVSLLQDWDMVRLIIDSQNLTLFCDIDGKVGYGTHMTIGAIASFFRDAVQAVLAPTAGARAYEALQREGLIRALHEQQTISLVAPYAWGREEQKGPHAAAITCTFCSPGVSISILPLRLVVSPDDIDPVEALRWLSQEPKAA